MRNLAPRLEAESEDPPAAPPEELDDDAGASDLDADAALEHNNPDDVFWLEDADETSRWSLARRVVLVLSLLIAAGFAAAPSIYFFFLREPEPELASPAQVRSASPVPAERIAAAPGLVRPAQDRSPAIFSG